MKTGNCIIVGVHLFFIAAIIAVPFICYDKIDKDFMPVLISVLICLTIGLMSIFALEGWSLWLNHLQVKKSMATDLEQKQALENLDKEVKELKNKVANMGTSKTETPSPEKPWFDLASNLKTKTTRELKNGEVVVNTIEEVPSEIRQFIIQNFTKP